MADPTLYLFDGYNLLHSPGSEFADVRELRDSLASFVAMRGARGVLVLDGAGPTEQFGRLEVRWAPDADAVLERLAAEHRDTERVCLVSSDVTVWGTSGQEVMKLASQTFLGDLRSARVDDEPRSELGNRVDDATRARLEELRRGRG
jgi:hypothetical protein